MDSVTVSPYRSLDDTVPTTRPTAVGALNVPPVVYAIAGVVGLGLVVVHENCMPV